MGRPLLVTARLIAPHGYSERQEFFTLLAASAALAASGDLDTTFGTRGKLSTDIGRATFDECAAGAQQADGKLVLAGSASADGETFSFAVARYSTTGRLDTTFGTGGKVVANFGGLDVAANAVAIQKDGGVVVGGDIFNDDGTTHFFLARFTKAGKPDTTFGTGGAVITNLGGGDETVFALAVQKDGKIVAGGYSGPADFSAASAHAARAARHRARHASRLGTSRRSPRAAPRSSDLALVRYATNGKPDTTFGRAGIVVKDLHGGDDAVSGIAFQADGKIVVSAFGESGPGATAAAQFVVGRFAANGTPDSAFGTGGIVTPNFGTDAAAAGVVVQKDGKIVAAGTVAALTDNDFDRFALLRLGATGQPDAGFGTGGKVLTPFTNLNADAAGIALQGDKLVVAGEGWDETRALFAVARYNTNGSLDQTFQRTGQTTTPPATGFSETSAVLVQTDGNIVAAGTVFRDVDEQMPGDFTAVRYKK